MSSHHLLLILLLIFCYLLGYGSAEDIASPELGTQESGGPLRIVSLKHKRYKSLHNVSSERSTGAGSSTIESPSVNHVHYEIPSSSAGTHHESVKSARGGGLQLQKSPPDLQFGLAFTVPFVSLSTEKLLNTVSGKNYEGSGNSVSSLLKLNFSGLLLAAVVGIAAAAGLFLPSLLNQHGLGNLVHGSGLGGGGGTPWLDGIIPQFTDNQYNDYGTGWESNKHAWGKDYNGGGGKEFNARRNGRKSGGGGVVENLVASTLAGVFTKLRAGVNTVEKCTVERVCAEMMMKKKKSSSSSSSSDSRIVQIVKEFKDNELIKDVAVVKVLRSIVDDGDTSHCGKVQDVEAHCQHVSSVEDTLAALLKSWAGGGGSNNSGEGGKM